jgi:cyclin T
MPTQHQHQHQQTTMTMTSLVTHLDISQLPSLKEGMTAEEEATKRRKTCHFIEEAGTRVLKLPRVAVSTAMVFFHRFYAKHSFQQHDRFEVAVAAIVLAAKTEESPKKLDTVLLECHKLKSRGMQAGRISAQQQNNGNVNNGTPEPTTVTLTLLDRKGEEFSKLKERILLLERVILHTIGFELSIDHPYKFFVEQIKKLIHTRQLKYKHPQPGMNTTQTMNKLMNELVQYSMSFANDSMHTSLCLQFTPQLIATACVFLACQFAKVEPVSPSSGGLGDWRKILGDPDIESLASISIQIMDLVAERKASDTDTFRKIRAQLELLKSREETGAGTGGLNKSPPPPPPPSDQPTAKRLRVG